MVSYLMRTGEKLFCNDSLARNKLRMSLCLRLNVRGPFSVPAGLSYNLIPGGCFYRLIRAT